MHKNSQKRIYQEGYVYFITSSTYNRYPYFEEKLLCELFIDNLRICKELKGFELFGFVILPDHFHMMLRPSNDYNYSQIIKSLKENFSRNVNIMMGLTHIGATTSSRLLELRYIFQKNYNDNTFPKYYWQKSFYDHVIRDKKDFNTHLNYIWYNPEKHKIINDYTKYKYSSYKNYRDLIDKIIS